MEMDTAELLMPAEGDLLYEEELLRSPYSLKMWIRYIEARRSIAANRRYVLYERALKALPGSYKLWHTYLGERRLAARGIRLTDPQLAKLNGTYERALVSMHKMPRIWTEYLEALMEQKQLRLARRTFDRALQALPITQHDRIWVLYLKFVMQQGVPVETAARVYRRYLKLEPTHVEEYIAYLKTQEQWGEAASRLADIVNDEMFHSQEAKSKHALWLELADICTRHPEAVSHLAVEAILRAGIRKFTDEVGRLWTSLADYFVRQGLFEKARDVYEEGIETVTTVRDFSLIFDALTTFETSLLEKRIAAENGDTAASSSEGDGTNFLLGGVGSDADLRLMALAYLNDRRPIMLSSVMLRQNPHNVHEWHKRVKLFGGDTGKQIRAYTEAIQSVDCFKAIGKPHTLWCAFAKFYDRHGDLANARIIFQKATEANFKYADDLASCWCEAAELELKHKNFKQALQLMRVATSAPLGATGRRTQEESDGPVQGRLFRSNKLWSFYCDLEESLGTTESTRAVYDQILDLRVATPQIVLNYALFLEEAKHFEDAFQAYERGVALFKFPHNKDIWTAYLTRFVQRYGGTKLERARDLFNHALREIPAAASSPVLLQYAALEEEHGLARAAMEVYHRAVRTVPQEQRLPIYDIYLSRASDFFGIAKVREVYEMAVEAEPPYSLSDGDCKTMCMRYARLETKVGEVDRARAIWIHASSLADPRVDQAFWTEWNEFEVRFGNEDTFREMLRIKRSVAASFSQLHFNTAIIDTVAGGATTGELIDDGVKGRAIDDMEQLEAQVDNDDAAQSAGVGSGGGTLVSGFVSAGVVQQSVPPKDGIAASATGLAMAADPEAIEIGEEGEDGLEIDPQVQHHHQQVTGAVAPQGFLDRPPPPATATQQGVPAEQVVGALDRFKRQKVA